MKNLENYGVQELDAKEISKTEGGVFGLDDYLIGIAVGATVAAFTEIISDWDHFKKGLNS